MWGREVRHLINFFYVGDGLVALTDPVWLQGAFDTLAWLFGRVVIWKKREYSWDDLPTLTCGKYSVVSILQASYGWGGTHLMIRT